MTEQSAAAGPKTAGPKKVILGIWIFAVLSLFLGITIGKWVFWLMAAAHVAEFGVFVKLFQRTGEPLGGHFLQTLLYGMFHVQDVKARLGEGGASA